MPKTILSVFAILTIMCAGSAGASLLPSLAQLAQSTGPPPALPEPSEGIIAMMGLAALFLARRRKRS